MLWRGRHTEARAFSLRPSLLLPAAVLTGAARGSTPAQDSLATEGWAAAVTVTDSCPRRAQRLSTGSVHVGIKPARRFCHAELDAH